MTEKEAEGVLKMICPRCQIGWVHHWAHEVAMGHHCSPSQKYLTEYLVAI